MERKVLSILLSVSGLFLLFCPLLFMNTQRLSDVQQSRIKWVAYGSGLPLFAGGIALLRYWKPKPRIVYDQDEEGDEDEIVSQIADEPRQPQRTNRPPARETPRSSQPPKSRKPLRDEEEEEEEEEEGLSADEEVSMPRKRAKQSSEPTALRPSMNLMENLVQLIGVIFGSITGYIVISLLPFTATGRVLVGALGGAVMGLVVTSIMIMIFRPAKPVVKRKVSKQGRSIAEPEQQTELELQTEPTRSRKVEKYAAIGLVAATLCGAMIYGAVTLFSKKNRTGGDLALQSNDGKSPTSPKNPPQTTAPKLFRDEPKSAPGFAPKQENTPSKRIEVPRPQIEERPKQSTPSKTPKRSDRFKRKSKANPSQDKDNSTDENSKSIGSDPPAEEMAPKQKDNGDEKKKETIVDIPDEKSGGGASQQDKSSKPPAKESPENDAKKDAGKTTDIAALLMAKPHICNSNAVEWKEESEGIVITSDKAAYGKAGCILAPYVPPAEYDLRLEYTVRDEACVGIIFVVNGVQTSFTNGAWNTVALIEGSNLQKQVGKSAKGSDQVLELAIRKTGCKATLNGKAFGEWNPPPRTKKSLVDFRIGADDARVIGLLSWPTTNAIVKKFECKTFGEEGETIDFAAAAPGKSAKSSTKPSAKKVTKSKRPRKETGGEFERVDLREIDGQLLTDDSQGAKFSANRSFQDKAPDKGVLVGFRVSEGKTFDGYIAALQPIYRVGSELKYGQLHGKKIKDLTDVVAKPGFAVGQIRVRGGSWIDGFEITFMKIEEGKLIEKGKYKSEWLGKDASGGLSRLLSTDGRLPIGLHGIVANDWFSAMGLILKPDE